MIKAIAAAALMSLTMWQAAGAATLSSDSGLKASAASEIVQVKGGGKGHARAGGGRRSFARRGGGYRRGHGGGGYGYGGGYGPCMWVGPLWVCP